MASIIVDVSLPWKRKAENIGKILYRRRIIKETHDNLVSEKSALGSAKCIAQKVKEKYKEVGKDGQKRKKMSYGPRTDHNERIDHATTSLQKAYPSADREALRQHLFERTNDEAMGLTLPPPVIFGGFRLEYQRDAITGPLRCIYCGQPMTRYECKVTPNSHQHNRRRTALSFNRLWPPVFGGLYERKSLANCCKGCNFVKRHYSLADAFALLEALTKAEHTLDSDGRMRPRCR